MLSTVQPGEAYSPKFKAWRMVVAVTLIMGYMGYYFNRSNLSVAQNSILLDTNITKTEFSVVLSVGYGVYAAGKFMNGFIIEAFGGRPLFLIGLLGSAVFTLLFTFFNTVAGFSAMWACNRFLQSVGWGALVKVVSAWYGSQEYGSIMGVMSLSYMLGDALIRLVFGLIINAGVSWQELYYIAASIALAVFIPALFTLKESPLSIGEPEPRASEKSVFVQSAESSSSKQLIDGVINSSGSESSSDAIALPAKPTIAQQLLPLLKSPKFIILLLESFVLTLIRELFNSWLPTYFNEVLCLSEGDSSIASLVFPLFGTFSALLGGYLVDHVRPTWRGGISLIFLVGLAATQIGLWAFAEYYVITEENRSQAIAIDLVLVALTGFVLIAPYSFVDGVFAMEIAGKSAPAVAVSTINGAGYIGAIVSPYIVSLLSAPRSDPTESSPIASCGPDVEPSDAEWGPVFLCTSAFAFLTMVFVCLFWYLDIRDIRALEQEESKSLLHDGKVLKL